MNAWIVLPAIVVVAVLFVLLPVGAATFARYRRPRQLRCPLAATDASVQVDAARAALWELIGARLLRVRACSRWPRAWGCRQQCLAQEEASAGEEKDVPADKTCGARTILVPLDGTPESEALLPAVAAVARDEGAALRLLRTSPMPPPVRVGERIVAYVDQETDRIDTEVRRYLGGLAARMPGIRVDEVVRFGEPADVIVAEAESSGADLIAMASHDPAGIVGSRWDRLANAVARATRIPVFRVPCGTHETEGSSSDGAAIAAAGGR